LVLQQLSRPLSLSSSSLIYLSLSEIILNIMICTEALNIHYHDEIKV
jgi:hypothetical protein